jgi:hypothetical protein
MHKAGTKHPCAKLQLRIELEHRMCCCFARLEGQQTSNEEMVECGHFAGACACVPVPVPVPVHVPAPAPVPLLQIEQG